LVSPALAKPVAGARTLILLDNAEDQAVYSRFFKSLADRGHEITFQLPKDGSPQLITYEELSYDHLVVLAPKIEAFGGELGVGAVIEFINSGGNVLLAGSSSISEAIRDLSIEFSVDFDEQGTAVTDHASHVGDDHNLVIARSRPAPLHPASPSASAGPVLFRGVGHRLTGKNPLVQPILVGEPSSYSFETRESVRLEGSPLLGSGIALVSALQARNNARVVFSGSADLFSDAGAKSGNEEFATALSEWAFQERGVLRIVKHKHHRLNEVDQHGIYRIKDEMVYYIEISEWRSGAWHAYRATDIQFEAIMLDPYIRATFKPHPVSKSATAAPYEATFKLPDTYGVFTFKVDYKRHGYSWLLESETVQVRPFRHNQYPRFLSAAYPYYANAISMMVAFFVFSAVFLYNRE
ncbi:Dolichyl-diphosphooligosaccharide--protein glycosyltransferase subunit WBP1, partial [Blyttiomyces helicus]